ncbi:MAG TPA: MFS transporter [Galbitalea sp.]|nr:MFS transporter [Galbitalea sp.]
MTDAATAPDPEMPRRFAGLRNRNSRPYLFVAGLSMMADNNEHVITYWVLWQKFHSPALVGFEVISHWLPFLLLSVWFGSLAQRYDCRRLIQIAQGLFMLVSVAWGILFLTDSLQVWEACVLLVLHGCAGALWGPAEQLMLHDFVDRRDLPSAVRLNATFRSLGILFGPVVGSALLLGLGSTWGIFANVLFYVPMTIVMARTKFTGHTRADADGDGDAVATPRVGLVGSFRLLAELRNNRLLVSMIVLAGFVAITIGGALQVSMPTFAGELGAGTAGLAYGVLLLANGIGGVVGGFFLEATGVLKPTARSAIIATIAFGAMTLVFALTHSYAVALAALVIGGVANIASMSITQSIVQLQAPSDDRGRVYGVYGVFASGLRTGNGLTLGILGAILGIPYSIALCAALLVIGTIVLGLYSRSGRRARE